MNIKKSLFVALVAMAGLTANAQEAKTEYIYQPNWYVQGQIGGQYTLGEISFGDLVSPTAQLGVGYNFNKVIGARFSVNAWQSKAGSEIKEDTYKWKWNYVAPKLDLTVDLTNLFCGFNPTRKVNAGIFGGIGANIAFGNDEAKTAKEAFDTKYADIKKGSLEESQLLRLYWDGSKVNFLGNVGAYVDFNVTEKLALGLEVSATTLADNYNSKKADNSDWYFNALVGLKYNLGSKYEKRTIQPEVNTAAVELERANAELAKARADLAKARAEMAKKATSTNAIATKKEVREACRENIYFTYPGNIIISEAEMAKIMNIADYMKKYPESKVSITGYADKGTGNARINMTLSQKRAAAVAELLKSKYGISADRITTAAKGDTEQPLSVEIMNRVSICIAE